MLIISHSCTKPTSDKNHRNSTTRFSISVNRRIANWITRTFLAVQNGKDDPKSYLITDIVNVTCVHERKTKCDNS